MRYGYLRLRPNQDRFSYAEIDDSVNVIYIAMESNTVIAIAGTFKLNIFDPVQFNKQYIESLLDTSK